MTTKCVLHGMFSHHLEFLKQRKIGEKYELLPSGWGRNGRDDVEGGGERKIL